MLRPLESCIFMAMILGGCIDASHETLAHPDIYCGIDEIVILQYGDERISKVAVSELMSLLEPAIGEPIVRYEVHPATESWEEFEGTMVFGSPQERFLPVYYSDQVHPDLGTAGTSYGGQIALYPAGWREGPYNTAAIPDTDSATGNEGAWAEWDRLVLMHEMGHELGLVNNGAEMQTSREDPDHAHHSTDRSSPMYFAVDTVDAFTPDLTEITDFTADDWADLDAVRAPSGVCHPFMTPRN